MPDGYFSPNLFHDVTYNGLRANGNTNSSCSNKDQKNSIGSKKITVTLLARGGAGERKGSDWLLTREFFTKARRKDTLSFFDHTIPKAHTFEGEDA